MTAAIFKFPIMVKKLDTPPNRVREWRLKRGMKQWQLADKMGVKQNAVSRIENGDRSVSLHRLTQIAKLLAVDIGQLLAEDDNRMGLDEAGMAVVRRLQEDARLAEPLQRVADTITSYDAGPRPEAAPEDRSEGATVTAMPRRSSR